MDLDKDLHFAVEILDYPDGPIMCTVARTADLLTGRGAYEGSLKAWPTSAVVLRHRARRIACSWDQEKTPELSYAGTVGDIEPFDGGATFEVQDGAGITAAVFVFPDEDAAVRAAQLARELLAEAQAICRPKY